MTVNSSESRVEYNCNGSVTAFTFNFRIFAASDLKIYISDSSGDTLLELGTHYTVTGLDGGTVNTLAAYPSGTKIIIVRLLPLSSDFDPEESGAIPSEALEGAIDRLVMIAQQLAAQIGRGLVLPITEQSSMELPGTAARASKFLFFAADGSVSVKSLAEIGAVTADESTIIMLDNILSLKDGGVTVAKLAQEVIDSINTAASNAVGAHNEAENPHPGEFDAAGAAVAAATAAIDAHEALDNPHSQYVLATSGKVIAAYGVVSDAGAKLSGSDNWTVAKNSTGNYQLNITDSGNYIVLVQFAQYPGADFMDASHDSSGIFINNTATNIVSGVYDGGFADEYWVFYAIKLGA